jgi:hypothetical protein
MKTKLLTLVLFLGSPLFADTRLSIGIGIETPYYAPPPPAPVVHTLACPGPEYSWISGYWYPVGPRYVWHVGYWERPPYFGAYWVPPRYYEHRYYSGHWGRRERGWDRDDRWEHHRWRRHHDGDDDQ